MLELINISKSFGKKKVLNGISLELKAGEILGFLGPNGAGKSTTIKTMLQLIFPDQGKVEFEGKALNSERSDFFKKVGVMIEEPALIGELNGWQNMHYVAKLRGLDISIDDIKEKISITGLNVEDMDKKTATYSTGMKQKLSMSMTLLHNPDILIYDEPTNGMDPQGILKIREMLKRMAHEENKAVFISSHLLHEVEKTCDRVIIINNGKIISSGTVDEVIRGNGYKDLEQAFLDLVEN